MRSETRTLVADTVTTVELDTNADRLELVNVGDTVVYAKIGGDAPTVAGDDTYILPASSALTVRGDGSATQTIKLISSGTPTVWMGESE